MKTFPTQFGVRENTASSRRHAARLAVNASSPQPARAVELSLEEATACPSGVGCVEACALPNTEPFVSAEEAAEFLSINRRYLLELARRGIAGAYALGTGSKRNVWVFRLSELAASVVREGTRITKSPKPCTIRDGSPR
jgi:hypothetical protein